MQVPILYVIYTPNIWRRRRCRSPDGATALQYACPKALVDQLGLKEGDELSVVAAKPGTIEVETRETQRRCALEQMAARNWTLLEGNRFNRDEANA